jgi:hypothetical protein
MNTDLARHPRLERLLATVLSSREMAQAARVLEKLRTFVEGLR